MIYKWRIFGFHKFSPCRNGFESSAPWKLRDQDRFWHPGNVFFNWYLVQYMIYLGLSYTFPDPEGITNARCPGVQVSRLQQEETKHLQAVQANQRLEKDMTVGQ